jgi:hypothetical protein
VTVLVYLFAAAFVVAALAGVRGALRRPSRPSPPWQGHDICQALRSAGGCVGMPTREPVRLSVREPLAIEGRIVEPWEFPQHPSPTKQGVRS